MTPMESLLNAIDNAQPILLPNPQVKKRSRPSSPQMSIESILDNSNKRLKRQCTPISPPPQSPLELTSHNLSTTQLTCYHATVAQKSYGSEKRFLCPPPIVQIKNNQKKNANISMSIVCETQPLLEQRTSLDNEDKGSFKYLFVTGTAKAKHFSLRINYQQQCFLTNPVSIISKPSKKTSTARNISTCLFNHSLVSLFNRINSQTVRTKYLTLENNQLCAKHAYWSPFEIIIEHQPKLPHQAHGMVSTPVTYGSKIILKDKQTGICSPSFIIKKVDRGQIIHDTYSVVSQMQKVALQLASSTDENPLYLNANGIAMDSQDDSNNLNNTNAWIDYTFSTKKIILQGQQEIMDDCHCWTIVGINQSEYEFQDNHSPSFIEHQLSPPPSPPQPRSIIPYPMQIEYISHLHALKLTDLVIQNDIWLGQSIGPLKVHNHGLIYLPDMDDILLSNHNLMLTQSNGTRYFELPLLLSTKQDGYMHPIGKSLTYHIHPHSQESGQFSIIDSTKII